MEPSVVEVLGYNGSVVNSWAYLPFHNQEGLGFAQGYSIVIVLTFLASLITSLYFKLFPKGRQVNVTGDKSKLEQVRLAPTPSELREIQQQLEGTWHLVAYKLQAHGPLTYTTHPLGRHAIGRLIYTRDDHMSVQIMKPGCPLVVSTNPHWGTAQEKSRAAAHYMAYGGRYNVTKNRAGQIVVEHRIDMSLYPNWVETVQARLCKLDGETLTLEPESLPSFLGLRVGAILQWEKAPRDELIDDGQAK